MEGRAIWIHQQQSRIGFDELSSMVSELMGIFEREESVSRDAGSSDWVSPSGVTRVVRHGSSAVLHSVLNQVPDAISTEYEVIHHGVMVFSWCEYLWPHLQRGNLCQRRAGQIKLPSLCLAELMYFHEQYDTSWLRRYRFVNSDDSTRPDILTEVDEVGVVAEGDAFQVQ